MWSLSLVMSECSLSGRGQGHVSNFYIVDIENFTTGSRWFTGDIHNSSVVGLFITPIGQWKRLDRVMVECTCFFTHCPTVTLQLHNFDLFRACCTSSFCTVACQLVRFQLTRRIARSLSDSWASCLHDLLHGFSGVFTDTSEHILFILFSLFCFPFLVLGCVR